MGWRDVCVTYMEGDFSVTVLSVVRTSSGLNLDLTVVAVTSNIIQMCVCVCVSLHVCLCLSVCVWVCM